MPATLLSSHRGETEYELMLLKKFLHISEEALIETEESATVEFNESLEEFTTSIENLDETDKLSLAGSSFMHQTAQFRREFPLKLRYGFIIQLYTLFEERSRGICERLMERSATELPPLPNRGNLGYVYMLRDWMSTNGQANSTRWDKMNDFRIIRNCVAHANGRIEGDRDSVRLREVIDRSSGVTEDEFRFISVSSDYCNSILNETRGIIDDIYKTTGFGAPFFLSSRSPREIGVSMEYQNDGKPIFRALDDSEMERLREELRANPIRSNDDDIDISV